MVVMAKHAVPAMARNEGEIKGSIVNMGSVAGLKGGTPHLLYPTSKGAVVNMTRAMAAHYASAGIRVNCVCPGVSGFGSCLPFLDDIYADALHADDVCEGHDGRGSCCPESEKLVRY